MKNQDLRLYRQAFGTLEEYCRERWGFTRMRASQLVASAEVIGNVNHGLQDGPSSERQARPLTKLPPEEQPIAWEAATTKAAEEGRKVTGFLSPKSLLVHERLTATERVARKNGISHRFPKAF